MIRRPPRSTLSSSSAASDVYKRQDVPDERNFARDPPGNAGEADAAGTALPRGPGRGAGAVSYTHLRAHETPEHLVCRLLLEKKNTKPKPSKYYHTNAK